MRRIPFVEKELDTYIEERKQAPCFICEVIEGKPIREKHHILYEDDKVIVFFSAFPTHLGQTLVCPKRHVEQVVGDMLEQEFLYLQKIVYQVAKAVQEVLEPERIYIASFGSQQMNKHVHFHILPLPKGVPVKDQQMAAMMPEAGRLELSEAEWIELAKKIRNRLNHS